MEMRGSDPFRDPDLLFARAVVRKGLSTRKEVHACLVEKAAGEGERSLADILVERGFITRIQAEDLARGLEKGEATVRKIGPFELLTRLGSGGMGSVYLARDTRVDKLYAVKLLSPELARDREYLIRFQREVDSLSSVDHPNLVSAVDWGEADGYYYLVMPFIQGENVFEVLLREGTLAEKTVVGIASGVARALEHAHRRGLVHRDVKPENIIMALNGQPLLTDLGLSIPSGPKGRDLHVTQEGLVVGTCYYVSPEQASGSRTLDARSDLYSLGATMYHMSTGEVPYSGDSPAVVMTKHLSDPVPWAKELNPALSNGLCHIVARLMAKDPASRYENARALLEELDRLSRGEPVKARPRRRPRVRTRSAPLHKPKKPKRLKKDLAWFGGGIGAGMLVVALGLAAMGGGGEGEGERRPRTPVAGKVDHPPGGLKAAPEADGSAPPRAGEVLEAAGPGLPGWPIEASLVRDHPVARGAGPGWTLRFKAFSEGCDYSKVIPAVEPSCALEGATFGMKGGRWADYACELGRLGVVPGETVVGLTFLGSGGRLVVGGVEVSPGGDKWRVLYRDGFETRVYLWRGDLVPDARPGSDRCARGAPGALAHVGVSVPTRALTLSADARVSFSYLCTGSADQLHANLWNEATRRNYQYVMQPVRGDEWTRVVFEAKETQVQEEPRAGFPVEIASISVSAKDLRDGEFFIDDVVVFERE